MAYPNLTAAGASNFAALTDEQKTVWGRDLWRIARNASFLTPFSGSGSMSMIQIISNLTKSEKGTRAVISLLQDLTGDGRSGDDQLEGNEEAINTFDMVVQIDQMRNANRIAGRMADQKSIINFRESSRDVLAYWLADRLDQLAFLTLSGVVYSKTNSGGARAGTAFAGLDWASDVTAPTRVYNWSGTALVAPTNAPLTDGQLNGNGTASGTHLAGAGQASYKMIVEARAAARDGFLRGIKGEQGNELYHMFLTPQAMKALKLDSDFITNVRHAGVRGGKNPLFAGSESYQVDGMMVHEYRHVYNQAPSSGTTKVRALVCGAQAMAMADIGAPMWVEDEYDYENQSGISVSKIVGMKKSVFRQNVTGGTTLIDHGVMAIDMTE